jgi:hypothetical protein
MCISPVQGAAASTALLAGLPLAELPAHENVRHLLFGSLSTVKATIQLLHKLKYAEPNDWSQPIATGRPNEVMAVLTKRVR